jgi:membrane glycosyltransferase
MHVKSHEDTQQAKDAHACCRVCVLFLLRANSFVGCFGSRAGLVCCTPALAVYILILLGTLFCLFSEGFCITCIFLYSDPFLISSCYVLLPPYFVKCHLGQTN